jgi:hypothetical protein
MLKVGWTGNGVAERTDLVDIEIPPGHSQVIMSLGRGSDADTSLPDLHPGDQLEVSAELEVTTDLTTAELAINRGKGCAGQPYDYPPGVTAALILASSATAITPAAATPVIARKTVSVSHDAHHFVFVFDRARLTVPTGWRGRGAINLILSASNPAAAAGHRLLIGQNEPDGSVAPDMGGISVVRLRGQTPRPKVLRQNRLRVGGIKIHGNQAPRVVYSLPLKDLRADEQMTVHARVAASALKLATRARLSTRVFLADAPTQTAPGGGYASQVAANKGRVTKRNGFNYLPGRVGPATQKVGVLRMTKDVTPSKTLYLNVVCDGGDPSKNSRVSDQLKLKDSGYIAVRRFPATALG